MSIQLIKERRAKAAAKLHAMFPRDDQGRLIGNDEEWTDEHQRDYDALVAEIKDCDAKEARCQAAVDLVGQQAHLDNVAKTAAVSGVSLDEAHDRQARVKGAFASFLRRGYQALTEEERQHIRPADVDIQAAARFEVGTDAGGGYAVPYDMQSMILEKMKAFGGMRDVASVMQASTGREINWPTTDATSELGEIVAEGAAAASSEVTLGQKLIKYDYYSSKIILVSWEFLQDTLVDIVGHITSRLATRIARVQNRYFTQGHTAGEVQGVVEDAAAGVTAANSTKQVTAVTMDSLNALKHSVDPAYRMGARYMFNDATLASLERMKDADGRPIWLPAFTAGNPTPPTLWGHPYTINQDMDTMAAGKKSILFGDFSKYLIMDAMDSMQLIRLTGDVNTAKRLVGFLMFQRTAGKLIDVGDAVRFFKNAAS